MSWRPLGVNLQTLVVAVRPLATMIDSAGCSFLGFGL